MAEYIEKESLIKRCRMIAECDWNTKAAPVSWSDAYESFADEIENFPAADVKYVVRSKWEITNVDHAYGHKCYHCPECGCDEWRYEETNFCPNCGADMRGADHAL